MAQVKVQTSAPLSGPGLTAVAPAVAMPSPGALGLQPTINGTVPATTPTCPSPASGFVDSTVPASPSGTLCGHASLMHFSSVVYNVYSGNARFNC